MTRFLVDAQLSPALARWLAEQGYPAEHVYDFGGDGTTDSQVWNRALQSAAVIISKDEDSALRAMREEVTGPQVVWIRTGNTRRAAMLQWFGQLLPVIISSLQRGERIVELT